MPQNPYFISLQINLLILPAMPPFPQQSSYDSLPYPTTPDDSPERLTRRNLPRMRRPLSMFIYSQLGQPHQGPPDGSVNYFAATQMPAQPYWNEQQSMPSVYPNSGPPWGMRTPHYSGMDDPVYYHGPQMYPRVQGGHATTWTDVGAAPSRTPFEGY